MDEIVIKNHGPTLIVFAICIGIERKLEEKLIKSFLRISEVIQNFKTEIRQIHIFFFCSCVTPVMFLGTGCAECGNHMFESMLELFFLLSFVFCLCLVLILLLLEKLQLILGRNF